MEIRRFKYIQKRLSGNTMYEDVITDTLASKITTGNLLHKNHI